MRATTFFQTLVRRAVRTCRRAAPTRRRTPTGTDHPHCSPTRPALAVLLLSAGCLAAEVPPPTAAPVPPPPTVREIRVPFDAIPVLFEKDTDRILLPRAEFDELERLAKKREDGKPPAAVLAAAAEYRITVSQNRAEIAGELTVSVLDDGLHALPLPFSGIGLRSAQFAGQAAAIGRGDDGALRLFVEGVGDGTLAVEAVAPLQTTAARQILDIALPLPAGTSISLTVPGDVELKSGAAVAARVWDEQTQQTLFQLVPTGQRLTLVMSLNSRLKRKDRVVVARTVLVDELTEAYERLHATVSLDVLHRAVEDFHFRLPAGFEVTDVQSPLLARWAVSGQGAEATLDVFLREETTGTVSLSVAALRTRPGLADWRLPRLEPLDVAGQVAVAGLLLESRLRIEEARPDGLIPIDSTVLARALPVTATLPDPGRPALRPVLAYYAPAERFALAGRFGKPPAAMRVTSNLLLTVRKSGLAVRGGLALVAENEKRFHVELGVPAGWDVTRVADAAGNPLAFERYIEAGQPGRLLIRFPNGFAPGEQQSAILEATHVPPGWLEPWEETRISFPAFSVRDVTHDIGALAVKTEDDLRARPDTLEGLTPLDENEKPKYGLAGVETSLAYRYELPPYAATLVVDRVPPRLTAETFSFFRVEQDAVLCHAELAYDVEDARAARLALLLPATTPLALSIRGIGDTAVKEFSSEEAGEFRRWRVELAEPAAGTRRLAVDFVIPLGETARVDVPLPMARADNVTYQSGFLAVEGNPELDVQIREHPRKVDVGELVDAEYQPGARILGAYGFVGEPPPVRLTVTRPAGCALPPAIIEKAEITTVLSADGAAQSQAVYTLRAKALYLEIELPREAQLWSMTVDGVPARPQQEHDRILLDLAAGTSAGTRSLLLVYETPAPVLGMLGNLRMRAPRLVFHEGAEGGAGIEVPAADLAWRVHLPTGFDVLYSTGTVVAEQLRRPGLAAVNLARAVYRAGGGVRLGRGLLGGCMCAMREAASLARTSRAYEKLGGPEEDEDAVRETTVGGTMAESVALPSQAPRVAAPPPGMAKEAEDRLLEAEKAARSGEERDAAGGRRPQEAAAPAKPKPAALWAVEGARSLSIDLVAQGPSLLFRSLGERPAVRVLMAERRRLRAFAWAAALGVLVAGAALTRQPAKTKALYLAAVIGAATLLPVLPGLLGLTSVMNAAFYGACLLVPYYLLAGLGARLRRARRGSPAPVPEAAAPVVGVLLLAALALGTTTARAAEVADSANPPRQPVIVDGVPVVEPVTVPPDALIAPYTPGAEGEAGSVLVPRARFLELWKAAHPERDRTPPPAAFALAGLNLAATLGAGDFLVLDGSLEFETFTDEYVDVCLPLEGVVLSRAVLDGQPARLRIIQVDPTSLVREELQQQAAQQVLRTPASRAVASLPVKGKGRHRLEMTLRVRLARQGGWRVAAGQLPAAPAATLDLTVAEAGTEVRLSQVPDRQVVEAAAAGEVLHTTLPADGALSIQWRPKVSEGQVDTSLTVSSNATFDVLDDRLQAAWAMELSFRHGDREFFAVELPAGYRVEKVEGVNVRGWEVTDDPAGPRLSVNLLKQAKENEAFTVHVWRQGAVGQEGPTAVEVPLLNVSGAVRHVGRLIVRHSPALSVQAGEPSGLRRIDMPAETVPALREGPLGVRPFQAFAFMQLPFSMRLSAVVARPDVSARLETILRVAERERSLESRVLLTVGRRPLHQVRVEVPADLDVERVSCPGLFEWGVSRGAGPQVLTVYFADGLQGEVPIVLGGRLGQTGAVDEVAIPRLWVLDVGRQDGYIAVQTDPMYDAVARALAQIESVLPGRLGWLSAEQRPFVRLAFYYRVADYAGAVALQARRPDARCHTVTNVRVTDRAIEETTLVCFTIYNAGVQEFRFRLPARLADARVSIPLLRQKRLEPLPDGGVAVILELQDQVMNDVRVLIEHDRLLTDQEQEVTLPAVETGRTDRQYLAIESAGRDEVLIEPGDGLEGLTPQQKEWGLVAALFQGGSTQAFIAKSGAVAPRLTFRTKGRVAVETAGARIGLAEALLAVDDSGAYRGSQTYHVDNRTEQFLELELPPGAALWTVRVADALVKPILPEPANPRRVQVPLVKTAAGDLDYTVVLKYAGRLEVPGPVVAADLPFARTVNINVEQSHVELWLPVTRRWFAFGGTLRQVRQGGEFEAGFLAYQNKLAKRLMETLQYGNAFEQARAVSNLRDVNERLAQSQSGMVEAYAYNEALQAQVSESQKIVVTAGRQIEQARTVQEAVALSDNRGRMAEAFRSQKQGLARNQVVAARSNWDESEVRKGTHSAKVAVFDDAWFEKNALVVQQGEKEPPGAEAPDASPKPPAPTRPQGQTAQQADQPQAVQVLDDVELKKAGEKRLTKAPARRDLQNRAVQYQQRLDAARGKADEAQEPAESSMQVDVNGMADLQAAVDNDGVSEGRDMDDRGLPFVALPADMAGLASLDVSIPGFDPRRWRAYRFTTPRGAVQVTARALSGRLIEGLERLAVALAGVGIVLGVFRLWRPWRPSPGSRRAIATYVMLAGFLCLLAGVFPVYGAVLLLVGLIWRVGLAVSHRVAGA